MGSIQRYPANPQSTSYNFSFFPILRSNLSSTLCYEGVKILRLLSFSNQISFSIYLGHSVRSYSSNQYSLFGKRSLCIAAMNAELPPFKNGDHNSESAFIIDRVITPLIIFPVLKACWVHVHAQFMRQLLAEYGYAYADSQQYTIRECSAYNINPSRLQLMIQPLVMWLRALSS